MKDALGHGSNARGSGAESVLNKAHNAVRKLQGAHANGIQGTPQLQRRHFEAIAAELKAAPDAGSPAHAARVRDMALKLATTNPGFRHDFFTAAATPGGAYRNKFRG